MGAVCTEQLLRTLEQVVRNASKKRHDEGTRAAARNDVSTASAGAATSHGAAAPFTRALKATYQALETVTPMLRGTAQESFIPIRLDCPTILMRLLTGCVSSSEDRETIATFSLMKQDWLSNLEPIALALIHIDSLSKLTIKEFYKERV